MIQNVPTKKKWIKTNTIKTTKIECLIKLLVFNLGHIKLVSINYTHSVEKIKSVSTLTGDLLYLLICFSYT